MNRSFCSTLVAVVFAFVVSSVGLSADPAPRTIAIKATEFTDGSLAVDVDNERTYRVCEEMLARREAAKAKA